MAGPHDDAAPEPGQRSWLAAVIGFGIPLLGLDAIIGQFRDGSDVYALALAFLLAPALVIGLAGVADRHWPWYAWLTGVSWIADGVLVLLNAEEVYRANLLAAGDWRPPTLPAICVMGVVVTAGGLLALGLYIRSMTRRPDPRTPARRHTRRARRKRR